MRKTPSHNPRGFEKNSWNYRCLQLRHAFGWGQVKLARVMGVHINTIRRLECGLVLRPKLETIVRIRRMEKEYADILKAYRKAPVRMDRLNRQSQGRVRLLPIEIRRPADIESLGQVEADSSPIFFGRGTRRRMQQIGMSVRWKDSLDRRNEAISRAHLKKNARIRGQLQGDKKE